MNKRTVIGILSCFCATAAFAAGSDDLPYRNVRIGFNVDYTWTGMEQLNKQLDNGTAHKPLKSGIAGLLDVDFALAPFLMVGVRTGYLYCIPADASYDYVIYNQKSTYNTSLIPLEAGVNVRFVLPATPVSVLAGIYGGYGFAFASVKNDVDGLGQTRSFTQPYYNGNFMGELLATVNFHMASAFSVNVNGGYRLAKIQTMVQTKDVSVEGIPGVTIPVGVKWGGVKGDILKDDSDTNLAFDFSGFILGGGISFDF